MENEFSVFSSFASNKPIKTKTIEYLFLESYGKIRDKLAERILEDKSLNKKQYSSTPSTLYEYRSSDPEKNKVISNTCWMVFDLDYYKMTPEQKALGIDLEDYLEMLRAIPYFYGARISAGGRGIFAVAKYDTTQNFKDTYKAIKADLLKYPFVYEEIVDDLEDTQRMRVLSLGDYWDMPFCDTFQTPEPMSGLDLFFDKYKSADGLWHHPEFMSMCNKALWADFDESEIGAWCVDNVSNFSDSLVKEWEKALTDCMKFSLPKIAAMNQFTEYQEMEFPDFPLDVFPQDLQDYIADQCNVKTLDPAFVAGSVLTAWSSVIGSKLILNFGPFQSIPTLFMCLAGPSGANKSAAINAGSKPLSFLDATAKDKFDFALIEYNGLDKESKKKAKRPIRRYKVISEGTVEGIMSAHQYNDDGFLWQAQEVDTVFKGLGQYSGKDDNGNYSKLLQIWDGEPVRIMRSDMANNKEVMKPRIPILGGTQIRRLGDVFRFDGSGMIDRWLFVLSNKNDYEFKDEKANERLVEKYKAAIADADAMPYGDKLVNIKGLKLHKEWVANAEHNMVNSMDREMYRKLYVYSGRLMLILHVIESAYEGLDFARVIPTETVKNALRLLDYFAETRQFINGYLHLKNELPKQLDLAEEVAKAGTLDKRERDIKVKMYRKMKYPDTTIAEIFKVNRKTITRWVGPRKKE